MKWGDLSRVEERDRLLYWVLMFVLQPYFEDPIDHWLAEILNGDGLAGDPGWEVEQVIGPILPRVFRVWADPMVSGIEPAERLYDEDAVLEAVRCSLLALVEIQPELEHEVRQTLKKYKL